MKILILRKRQKDIMNHTNEKLPIEISQHILTIGPDYKNHRGGVGAVIDIYSKYFEDFNFIPSYKVGSFLEKFVVFVQLLFNLVWTLSKNSKIKIVHVHGASYGSFLRKFIVFFIVKKIFKKKYIYHVHGGEFHLFYKRSNALIKRIVEYKLSHIDTLICLSEQWYQFFDQHFKVKNICIVPNIIDYPNADLIQTNSKKINLLFLGYIGNKKGVFDLLEVLRSDISFYEKHIKLQIGGNGEIDKLKSIILEFDLTNIVEYIGWVSADDKCNYLNNCDVYILPSYNEGLPISILEAMSYAKPIISTNVGGIPEIIIPSKNGFLVEPGDLKSIDNSIRYCINNKHYLNNLGQNSRIIVEKHLPNYVISVLKQIYKSLK